jgi:hypothetical protein
MNVGVIQVTREEVQQVVELNEENISSHTFTIHYLIHMVESSNLILVDKIKNGLKITYIENDGKNVLKYYNSNTGELIIDIGKAPPQIYDIQFNVDIPYSNIFYNGESPVISIDPNCVNKSTITTVNVKISDFKLITEADLTEINLSVYPTATTIGCIYQDSFPKTSYDDSNMKVIWSYEDSKLLFDEHRVEYHVSIPDIDNIEPIIFKTELNIFYNKHILTNGKPIMNTDVYFTDNGLRYKYLTDTILELK